MGYLAEFGDAFVYENQNGNMTIAKRPDRSSASKGFAQLLISNGIGLYQP